MPTVADKLEPSLTPLPGDVDLVALDRLVGAERVMDADVLIDVSRRHRGVQVGRDADVVVQDLQVVEGVGAARTIEEAEPEVEVEDLQVGDSPVLVVAAVEDEGSLRGWRRPESPGP